MGLMGKGGMRTYDYVVVGGGTSGVVLATRLAERQAGSVALIEAGPTDRGRPEVLNVRQWMDLLGGELDYDYAIAEQPRGNSLIRHSRARVLGGCSSHNSCIAFQAPDRDLDQWEAAGARGWGAAELQSYYERVWKTVPTEQPGGANPLHQAIMAAAGQVGLPQIEFGHRELAEGASPFRLNIADGKRQSTAVAYLHNRQVPDNLEILTETTAIRLLFEGERTAAGVDTSQGDIRARREVVVCAGAFDSPKLLMLSGIGDGQRLQDLGIPVRADLPAVGGNLLDHPEGVVVFETARPVPEPISQFWEVGIFARVDADADAPDLMFHVGLMPFTMNTEPWGAPVAEHGFSLTPNVTRARSRGAVTLGSADPAAAPVIDFGYFTDPEGYDERIMLAGIKLARRIGQQSALHGWVARELAPGADIAGDAQLSAYARQTANTVYHPAGTCRMGQAGSVETVVDPQLRVVGVDRLRVCDASVFPTMTTVNPGITCMMLGERAADLVLS